MKNKDAIIADIQIHLMQANWWIASTLNGQAKLRQMKKYSKEHDGYILLTKDELIEEAMQTAQRHLHTAYDLKEMLFESESNNE